jgi:hypothetical protein
MSPSQKKSKCSYCAQFPDTGQCDYETEDADCEYCKHHHRTCGKKMTKHDFLYRTQQDNSAMASKQASYFLDFWLKSMKVYKPTVGDLAHLDAFQECLENKRLEIERRGGKRSSPLVEEVDFDDEDSRVEGSEGPVEEMTPGEQPVMMSDIDAATQGFMVGGTAMRVSGPVAQFGTHEFYPEAEMGTWFPLHEMSYFE